MKTFLNIPKENVLSGQKDLKWSGLLYVWGSEHSVVEGNPAEWDEGRTFIP